MFISMFILIFINNLILISPILSEQINNKLNVQQIKIEVSFFIYIKEPYFFMLSLWYGLEIFVDYILSNVCAERQKKL